MVIEEADLSGEVQGRILRPDRRTGLGVLVITGSSGRVDVDRARLFAQRGAVALAQRWWGGQGQEPGINEIPIERFVQGVDQLVAEGCDRIATVGSSYGAVAALLAATKDTRIDVVIAESPSHVVWQCSGPGRDGSAWPPRSSHTWGGVPLPYMTWDPRVWPPAGTVNPAYRPMHELSLRTFAEDVEDASIPVEAARADIILVAGGADALWPSAPSAHAIAERLRRHGKESTLVEHRDAGHSICFPGEPVLVQGPDRNWGGNPTADQALGADAWDVIVNRLLL